MKTEFYTKGFEKTESMDEFLRTTTLAHIESFLKNERDIHLRVTVDEDSHRTNSRRPHFVCEIQLKTAGSKKIWKVHKTNTDFHQAVLEAGRALKKILQRRSDRRHAGKSGLTPNYLVA